MPLPQTFTISLTISKTLVTVFFLVPKFQGPEKMEEFAEHLVQKARNQEPKPWRTGGPLEE